MTKTLKYPKGTALQFTEGCYSDYRTMGAVVTIEDCDLIELGKQFVDENELDEDIWSWPSFAGWLCSKGLAMHAEIEEVHLDDGYQFDLHKR